MKLITITALTVLLAGCAQPEKTNQQDKITQADQPKKAGKYVLKIQRDELNLSGSGFQAGEKIDTLQALTDQDAYTQAVKTWWGTLRAEKLTQNRVSTSHSFKIVDSAGEDLKSKLPLKITDSIDNYWKAIASYH